MFLGEQATSLLPTTVDGLPVLQLVECSLDAEPAKDQLLSLSLCFGFWWGARNPRSVFILADVIVATLSAVVDRRPVIELIGKPLCLELSDISSEIGNLARAWTVVMRPPITVPLHVRSNPSRTHQCRQAG
jgi:hypothetical protein